MIHNGAELSREIADFYRCKATITFQDIPFHSLDPTKAAAVAVT